MKKALQAEGAPAAIGPYSPIIELQPEGKFYFLSGQIALDSKGQMVSGGITAEAKQVMQNIGTLLKAAGLSYEHVVKTTIFLKNFNDFSTVNSIYGEFFTKVPPARSTVEVARLPKDALVEIECIACR